MARRKGGRRPRQGIVSWITSVIALLLGLGPALVTLGLWMGGQLSGDDARGRLNSYYNPLAGDRASLAVGYGSLVGGLVFKTVTSELTRRAKIRSIIPALRA